MSSLVQRVRPLALFALSGCLALLVDTAVLYLFRPALGDYGARLVSFCFAATFTWWFNRTFTFGRAAQVRALSIWAEYSAYLSSMAVGGVVNYGAYAASVYWVDAVRAQPAWGVAIGSLFGMVLNFWSAHRILRARLGNEADPGAKS